MQDESPENLRDESAEEELSLDPGHKPVLVAEVLRVLDPQSGEVYLDCTLGRGGHASIIAGKISPGGRVIGLDVDPANIAFARERLTSRQGESERTAVGATVAIDLIHSNFSLAMQVLEGLPPLPTAAAADARASTDRANSALSHHPGVDILLADLGFASSQMTDSARGFSFNAEGPLDMRLDPGLPTTAADLVNRLPEKELADVIYQFGEDRLSRRIARKIVEERSISPILSTTRLAEAVRRAYGRAAGARAGRGRGRSFRGTIDPATRTFMALRIAVNAELEALDQLLADLPRLVKPGGRAGIISFHSLEDRRVKQAFLALEKDGRATRLTRKPMTANDDERRDNPRSRSAKLRAVRLL